MNRAELESLDKASLVELALRQGQRIAELEARLADVERRFEELARLVVRGAAPFARPEGKRSTSPKPPGRKGGHKGSSRRPHTDAEVDQRIEVPLEHCPRCGGALAAQTDEAVEQTLIEAPVVKALIIRLVTHRNRCACCGIKCASTHPLQVSTATGAAGVHLGPRALALAAELNKGMGLTMRRTCQVLRELLGISLSPGGLSQALARVADRMAPHYEGLLANLKAGPVLHADETSWWVAGKGASLWVLTSPAATLYRVVASKTRAQAEALMGGYQGVLVSDCLNLYDDLTPTQHKCYAHHLKIIGKALEDPRTRGSPWLKHLRGLLVGAMVLKSERGSLPSDQVADMRAALSASAERLLAWPRNNPADQAAPVEEKVRLRLRKQQDHLFTFLDHDAVPATNNLAERQLRPAVISRKLSCGNKTEAGARTWQILASLAATCRQNGQAFADFLAPNLALKPLHTAAR
jgi:transposase